MRPTQLSRLDPTIDSIVRTGATQDGTPLRCAFTSPSEYAKAARCNPGIQRTVLWLMGHGFETMDSGDGKTHEYRGCDRDHAYVVVNVRYQADLMFQVDKLVALLGALAIPIRPIGTRYVLGLPPEQQIVTPESLPKDQGPHVEIQANYDPGDRSAHIDISYLDDELLVRSVITAGKPR